MGASLTQDIGRFVSNVEFDALPSAAIDAARLGFTDCVAVMLAGQNEQAVRIVATVSDHGDRGASRLFLGPEQTSPERAALVNGTAAHVLDYDDVALAGHPSAVLVPAILALADELGSDGRTMIAAYVAGYEVWAELLLRETDKLSNKGWHPTAVLGAPAAAASSAVLLGLDAERSAHAVAISASMSSGILANFGTMTKSFQVGRAAQAGVSAARLAKAGLTGAADAMEHPRGFLGALSPRGRFDVDVASQIGREWRIERFGLNVKRYPMCYCTHRAADAILDLLGVHPTAPDDIASIEAYIGQTSANILRNTHPETGLEAKFSIEFAMASAVHAGRVSLAQLVDSFVTRPDVGRTMDKVERHVLPDDPDNDLPFATADYVVLNLSDGKRLESERVTDARGSIVNPLDSESVWEKFQECTQHHSEAEEANRLFEQLQKLETVKEAASLRGGQGQRQRASVA